MKTLYALLLVSVLAFTAIAQEATIPRLTNKEIVDLVQAGLTSDVIIAKIKVSRCNFNTDAPILTELKQKGVPNDVLKAMIEAPYGMPTVAPTPKPEPTPAPAPPAVPTLRTEPARAVAVSDSLPVYAHASELLPLRRVYITADEPSSRDLIRAVFNKYEGLTVVNSPEEAEFFIECGVKASTESRGLQRSHYIRQQMTAFMLDNTGRKRILWYENETYEERNGLSFSRPNEVNMAMHFVKMLKSCGAAKDTRDRGGARFLNI